MIIILNNHFIDIVAFCLIDRCPSSVLLQLSHFNKADSISWSAAMTLGSIYELDTPQMTLGLARPAGEGEQRDFFPPRFFC